jgi:hypothetical protein
MIEGAEHVGVIDGQDVYKMPAGWLPPGYSARSVVIESKQRGGQDGLGDKIERVLKSLGITEERYSEMKRVAGFSPNCGCRARKEFFNKLPAALIKGFAKGGIAGAVGDGMALAKTINKQAGEKHG